jgi:hypothetical protein
MVLFDGDEIDERDFEIEGYAAEAGWFLVLVDMLWGGDTDEPLIELAGTLLSIGVACTFDPEEFGEADDKDLEEDGDNDIMAPGFLLGTIFDMLVGLFFISMRPTVNLLASCLTYALVVAFYEIVQDFLLIHFNVFIILCGIAFNQFVLLMKLGVAVMQNFFLMLFVGDD